MKHVTVLEYIYERRNMGTRICPYCGSYLDPEEKCDCRKDKEE